MEIFSYYLKYHLSAIKAVRSDCEFSLVTICCHQYFIQGTFLRGSFCAFLW